MIWWDRRTKLEQYFMNTSIGITLRFCCILQLNLLRIQFSLKSVRHCKAVSALLKTIALKLFLFQQEWKTMNLVIIFAHVWDVNTSSLKNVGWLSYVHLYFWWGFNWNQHQKWFSNSIYPLRRGYFCSYIAGFVKRTWKYLYRSNKDLLRMF